ncbi:MAG TPA: cytochrome c [Steroidobacteraceae bacterium]|nr:cytochrome c [Steroidobacteraceae bacterium]
MRTLHVASATLGIACLTACASQPASHAHADRGQAAYESNCLACHQADGTGVRGFQPALVGSDWVRGDPKVLATFVLTGGFDSAGRKLSANENVMPPFSHLDDATLAAALTYVRMKFGDQASAVSAEEVAAARAQLPPAH